ncbi:MAG: 2-oxoacid:acceptor oxidoreductase subunit alpha [Chloroflexi bacterium]|nr:2-oxoacid:acceptor oxidoreductase subunit alpha [Chloroflexota bacterium]
MARSFDLTWMIGGPQGGGINASAEMLAKAFSRAGLYVFANIEYHSNIMGKHSYYRVRVSDDTVHSHVDRVHVLAALDAETLLGDHHHNVEFPTHHGHGAEVVPGGAIIFNPADERFKDVDILGALQRDDVRLVAVPFDDVLKNALAKLGREKEFRQMSIMYNTIVLAASVALIGFDEEQMAAVVRDTFTGRRAKSGELNLAVMETTYQFMRANFADGFPFKVKNGARNPEQILIRGVQAAAIGKLKAGCALQTYYPISPATDESTFLESHQRDYNIVVVQAEDEISSVNMAVAASHMGVRASTSTSGPGFSLMPEGVGFAAITEAPLVLVDYQRGGPSTGQPTRTEQGDLQQALHFAHGDFPHIVVAPGDHAEIFYAMFHAFNWADHYQMPVIVLLDKFLASTYTTIRIPDMNELKVDRGLIYQSNNSKQNGYLRHRVTENGITPRAIPGTPGSIFWTTTDEHNPKGHISEGIENRMAQADKRMRKLDLAAEEIADDLKYSLFGPTKADITILGWGSTKGAILDAVRELRADGIIANYLQLRVMRPFPVKAVTKILTKAKSIVDVEENYGGQLADLAQEKTGVMIARRVVKYDGRPFSQDEVLWGVRQALKNKAGRIVVVTGRENFARAKNFRAANGTPRARRAKIKSRR